MKQRRLKSQKELHASLTCVVTVVHLVLLRHIHTVARRELWVRVTQRRLRTRVVRVATACLNAQACAKEELAGRYPVQWEMARLF
jgi:hypothetical protein